MKKPQRKPQTYDAYYDVVYRDRGWDVSGPAAFRASSLGEAQDWINSQHKKVRAMQRSISPTGSMAFRVGVCATL